MMFSMPQYEVRLHDGAEWEEISEIDLMQRLHESYGLITPAIQLMIDGGQVLTPDAAYRLKDHRNH